MRKFVSLIMVILTIAVGAFCLSACADKPIENQVIYEINARETGYKVVSANVYSDKPLVIKSEIDGLPVVEIASMAFFNNDKLVAVEIPASVTRIGQSAFEGCVNLQKVTFASNSALTRINKSAFKDCKSLRDFEIPSNVNNILYGAFFGCESLENIVLPPKIRSMSEFLFSGNNSLKSITIPQSVTSISHYVFKDCIALKEIIYIGTAEQWANVSKEYTWLSGTTINQIICRLDTIVPIN